MATLNVPIRIKRGDGLPTQLRQGELAFDQENTRLYIGSGTEVGGYAPNVVELTTPPTVLEDLANISLGSGASDGDVLVYDGATGDWVAQALAAASVAWGDITSKPAAFPPDTHASSHHTGGGDAIAPADIGAAAATHMHSASDITSGLAAVATSGAYSDLSGKPVLGTAASLDSTAFADADHEHSWSDITSGVPSTFAPTAHNHAVTMEITGFIESPAAKTYVLSPGIPAAITITDIRAKTGSGTVDIKLQDDGVDIANMTIDDVTTAVGVPTTESTASVAENSVLSLVVSDLQSSPADLAFSVHYTVTSANNA